MGRELRKVPANWKHPEQPCTHMRQCDYSINTPGMCFKSLYKGNYDEEASRWLKECIEWSQGKRSKYNKDATDKYYWDYAGNPPNREDYADYAGQPAIWFQVYQTVSEGYPVTPPFETREELVKYLTTYGDSWDQRRGSGPWSEAAAKNFVFESGWAPSMIVSSKGLQSGVEGMVELN